jgi:hypothetical protein
MESKPNENDGLNLPACAVEFIRQVRRKMRYRRKVADDVQAELTAHFEDELRDCTNPEEREEKAQQLIEQFGDPRLLAVLCRRAKKRCRPLWCKVIVRSMQAVGIILLYIGLRSLPLLVGTPSLKVDYLAWLSERTRAGHEESLNARPYFDKAIGLLQDEKQITEAILVRPSWPGDMNEPQRQIVADVAKDNAEAFEMVRQGVTKPYYWIEYETAVSESLPAGITEPVELDPAMAFNQAVVPAMGHYKRFAQAFQISILWRAYQGHVSSALDDSLVLIDFAMHLEGRGTLIEQLVGIAIEGLGRSLVTTLLDRCEVSGADLARVQDRIRDLYARHETVMDVTGEKAVFLGLVQRMYTDDGSGNGHVLKRGLPLAARDWQDGVASLLLFGYPDRREMTSLIDALWQEYQLALATEPSRPQYEQHQAQCMALAQQSYLLAEGAPAMDRIASLAWHAKTGRRALLTTVAVMRYAADKGVYPPALDALVAEGYVNELLIDPYSGLPFGYRRTGDGFLLYSVGENGKDDGGQQGVRNGQPRLYAENGDWVFWPPEVTSQAPKKKTPARTGMDEEKAAEYRAAAPLNHTVRIERTGSYLKLNYELIGTDGKKYDLWKINDRSRPGFAIYRGDTQVGGGTFEFG